MRWGMGVAGFAVAATMGCAVDNAQHCGAAECRDAGVPHVSDKGTVTIYPGEHFTIVFTAQGDKLVPAVANPAGDSVANGVDLAFSKTGSGMMLTVTNPMSGDLKYDATMRAPDDRLVYTSSCPVRAGLSTFEGWPHEIKYLELSNFRLLKDGDDSACR